MMRKSRCRRTRALSAMEAVWQSRRCNANRHAMKRSAILLAGLAATAAAIAAPVATFAAQGGALGTLQTGRYTCELPGDALGPSGHPVAAEAFSIINASSYAVGEVHGTYLLTGDRVTITSGPKRGQRFRRVSASFLRKLDASGKDSPLRCVRTAPIRD